MSGLKSCKLDCDSSLYQESNMAHFDDVDSTLLLLGFFLFFFSTCQKFSHL